MTRSFMMIRSYLLFCYFMSHPTLLDTKSIVENHGGSIRVKSCVVPGRSWTVFSVFLPAAPLTSDADKSQELVIADRDSAESMLTDSTMSP
jgi:hypothetical protein